MTDRNIISDEGIRLEEFKADVIDEYPEGAKGHLIIEGERSYLGSVIELPDGYWQAHIPGSEKQEDPYVAVEQVLNFNKNVVRKNNQRIA